MRFAMLVLTLALALGIAAHAQKNQASATLKVVNYRTSGTANPQETLHEFTVSVTNTGQTPLRLSNNMFVVTDDEGKRHMVTRGRYPERVALDPGKSDTLDRIYFNLPTGRKPKSLALMFARREVGSVDL